MMPRLVRASVLAMLVGPALVGCAHTDTATADPEAQRLDPPVVIVDDPPPEPDSEVSGEDDPEAVGVSPATLVEDPETEVITFAGEDADPGMSDEITSAPKRDSLPSMMSTMGFGPNK